MSQVLSFAADAVLALLLCVTLIMATRLHRALRAVGRDRTAFETLVSSLSAATNSVKVGIQALRAEAERATAQIERRSEEADKMATDLSFLIEAADRACTRLEQRLTAETSPAIDARQSSAAADRLKKGVQFLHRRQAKTPPLSRTGSPQPPPTAVPDFGAESPLADAIDDAPAALRKLAGITTRGRGDHSVLRQGRPDPNLEVIAIQPAIAARDTTQIKLVG